VSDVDDDSTDGGEEPEACEWCAGIEDAIAERAVTYKTNGWDPGGEGSWYRYGFTTSCEVCGRGFDHDEADRVYEETAGPESPTGSPADEIRRLAADLGLDPDGIDEFIDVYQRRPMQ
jgi:hypothetical protein